MAKVQVESPKQQVENDTVSFNLDENISQPNAVDGLLFKGRMRCDGRYTLVAIRKYIAKETTEKENDRTECYRDLAVLKKPKKFHENFIRYYNEIQRDNYIYVAIEYCEYSVADFFGSNQEQTRDIREKMGVVEILRESTEALAFLHEYGYIHRNLKPSNFRVARYNNNVGPGYFYQIKITGFKYARNYVDVIIEHSGTRRENWYPPECAKSGRILDDPPSVDVFVLGIYYFYVLFGGIHPFGSNTNKVYNTINEYEKKNICEQIQSEDSPIYKWADDKSTLPWKLEVLSAKYESLWGRTAGYLEKNSGEVVSDALNLIKRMLNWEPNRRILLKNVVGKDQPFFQFSKDYEIYTKEGIPGLCLIFCQTEFKIDALRVLPGHADSRDGLESTFKQLGFDVSTYTNLNAEQIREELKKVRGEEVSSKGYKCFVACFLSHGNNRGVYSSDGTVMDVNELILNFNSHDCRWLHDKPKIFIIDACRSFEPSLSVVKDFLLNLNKKLKTMQGRTTEEHTILELLKKATITLSNNESLTDETEEEIEKIEHLYWQIERKRKLSDLPFHGLNSSGEASSNQSPANDVLLVMSTIDDTYAYGTSGIGNQEIKAGSYFISYIRKNLQCEIGKSVNFNEALKTVQNEMARVRCGVLQTPERRDSLRKNIILQRK